MKIQTEVNGKTVIAVSVDFVVANGEPWIEYHLEDGTIVRVKFVMTRIFDTGERNPNGERIFQFQWQAVSTCEERER